MSTLVAVTGVLGKHSYGQSELTDAVAALTYDARPDDRLLRRVHASAGVRRRHLALPLEDYAKLNTFGAANDAFLEVATAMATESVAGALGEAGLPASAVDLVVSTTVTGIAVPSLEARIAADVGLRADVKRVPMMGLGCVAGAAGIARIHDYLLGHPADVAVLLSVELCSLTLQRGDASPAALIASALFGDGAAAVVIAGPEARQTYGLSGPVVLDTRSHLYPGTERAMGWDVADSGLGVVLGPEVPDLVRRYLGADVDDLLAAHDLGRDDIAAWVCHPGGPKVLDAVAAALDQPASAFARTWESLAQSGNLSSASVLHVLRDTMADPPPPGAYGLILGMGPGFCSELVLVRW